MQKTIKFCTIFVALLAAIALVTACGDKGGSTSPSTDFTPANPSVGSVPQEPPSSSPTTGSVPTPSPSGSRCDLIDVNLNKSKRSVRINGNTVTMTVFAESDLGSLYVRLWYNARHENRIRPDFPVNEEFSFTLPGPGDYHIVADVENDSSGRVVQCDRLNFDVTITPPDTPPEDPTCKDFEAPDLSISGEPQILTNNNRVRVKQGTISDGVTFDPNLPFNVQRPPYGDDPGEWSFTAFLSQSYGPEELECVAEISREFSGEVPPKEPTCEQENPTRFDAPQFSVGNTYINIKQNVYNGGEWEGRLYAGTENNPHRYLKKKDNDVIEGCRGEDLIGSNDTLKYRHSNHNACYWTYELYLNGSLVDGPYELINRCNQN